MCIYFKKKAEIDLFVFSLKWFTSIYIAEKLPNPFLMLFDYDYDL